MARAAVQYLRDERGGWRPVGVWFATKSALQQRFLPGVLVNWSRQALMEAMPPPVSDLSTQRGTWEDFIEESLDALSNGHDLHIAEVEPELTLDMTYARYVLGLTGEDLTRYQPRTIANVRTIPVADLDGPASRA